MYLPDWFARKRRQLTRAYLKVEAERITNARERREATEKKKPLTPRMGPSKDEGDASFPNTQASIDPESTIKCVWLDFEKNMFSFF